jgi:hypothetical protein
MLSDVYASVVAASDIERGRDENSEVVLIDVLRILKRRDKYVVSSF